MAVNGYSMQGARTVDAAAVHRNGAMDVYTRKGDEGFTSLLGSQRVRKDDPRIEAIGTLDELNTHLGLALCEGRHATHTPITNILQPIQEELPTIASRLAALGTGKPVRPLSDGIIERMECQIDTLCQDLAPLQTFLVPGGCELACRLHVCRAVCRAAERTVVHLLNPTDERILYDPLAVRYLNRLSDLLFTLARLANRDAGETELP